MTPGKVLFCRVPAGAATWLESKLRGLHAKTCDGPGALARLASEEFDVLVLQHHDQAPSSLEILRQMRSQESTRELPVLYVLDSIPAADLLERLVSDFGVFRVLIHPLDPDVLVEELSRALKLRPAHQEGSEEDLLEALWKRVWPSVEQKVTRLELAVAGLLEGELEEDTRRGAERIAHQLAGTLGSYGYPGATRLALELEDLLKSTAGEAEVARAADLAVELRRHLEHEPRRRPAVSRPEGQRGILLLNTPDRPFRFPADRLDYQLNDFEEVSAARAYLAQDRPAGILVNLDSEDCDERLNFLAEAAAEHPDLPILALVRGSRLEHKLPALRHGARRFLEASSPPELVLATLEGILHNHLRKLPRVLVLDDDPAMLLVVETTLLRAGMVVRTIESPARLLWALEDFGPDLIVVDVDMPVMSGLEVCRLLRGTPRWAGLPLLVLTSHKQPKFVEQAFRAGADDFVVKPVVGPELVARIKSRVELGHVRLRLGTTDPVTGLGTRARALPRLEGYLELARRNRLPMALAVVQPAGAASPELSDWEASDTRLARLGQLMKSYFRGEDDVSYWGDSRFVLGMYGMVRRDGLRRLADLMRLHRARHLPEEAERGTFAAGLALFPEDGEGVEELFRKAATHLERAREAGGGCIAATGELHRPEAGAARRGNRVDVVLVEDDTLLAPLVLHALENRGYSTVWIPDGLEAVDRLTGTEPEVLARLILLDVDLPGLAGTGVLRKLRDAGVLRSTRVVMLTVRASEQEVLTCLELGADDHVAKPFSLPILLERVRLAIHA